MADNRTTFRDEHQPLPPNLFSSVPDVPITRRSALRQGLLGVAGLMLADCLNPFARLLASSPATPAPGARARAVIQIWLWGGACHLDTFDPKPGAPTDFVGPLNHPISTAVDGIQLCELLPTLAREADKFSLIRSMSHGVNAHETASYMVQTGRSSGGRDVFPSVGAVVSLLRGYEAGYTGLIPPYVVLTEPQGRFSEAGFLGSRYKPFATGGDPARTPFAVEGVVAEGISTERQRARRELLGKLDALPRALPGNAQLVASAASSAQAYDLILGDAGKVFDLATEPDALRDRYGRSTFGQSCLMARRLVERGVPYVTINYKGWDTHKRHFQEMRRMLPELDKGLATLLADLAARGLLESTVVWCSGEFGRTPRIQWEPPWNGGRGHYGRVFSALLAGGGFRGGQVVGASDARGEEVADRPVHPVDLIASIYDRLGIAPDARLPHPQGDDVRAVPREATGGRSIQLLREIM